MAKPSKGDSPTHDDAWSRFERAVDVVAKSPPQHKIRTKKEKRAKKPKKRAS